ncbi:hypothetical protein EON67_04075 [archaeon]|nr:MAG: hypothetical protein EON67_04075 [archaeon]
MRLAVFVACAVAALASGVRVKVGSASLWTTGGKPSASAAPISRTLATYPQPAATTLSAKAGQQFSVSFGVTDEASGEAMKPHQAFVKLTHTTTGVAAYYVAQPDTSIGQDAGNHRMTLDVSNARALGHAAVGGTFDVDVIIGDASIDNPVMWRIGRVELTPPSATPKPATSLYTQPLLHESDVALAPLPLLQHTFRAPAKRPAAVLSYAAAGVIVAAAVAWMVYVLTMLPGMRWSFPWAAVHWAVPFHASLLAIGALFTAYWLWLDMFSTLSYLALLAVPTALTGRQLLRYLNNRDLKAVKSE